MPGMESGRLQKIQAESESTRLEIGKGKMGDGTKLAVAIAVMWIAMVFFFFAFHPGGVENVSNPGEMLQWLLKEFTNITSAGGAATTSDVTSADTSALSYPGYTAGSSDIGTVNPGGVQAV